MNRQLLFGARSPDSTRASLAVTLCGRKSLLVQTTWAPAADDAAMQIRTRAARNFTRYFFAKDDWTILAWSRCAAMAGRTLVMRSFSSAFLAFGIRTLSIASRTCW